MRTSTLSPNVTNIILSDESIIYGGGFDIVPAGYDLVHFVDSRLKDCRCFLDIGANVGSFTLLAKGYPNTQFISFEPIKKTFNILKQNIELNNITNVMLVNKGLSNKEEVLKMYIPINTNSLGGSSIIKPLEEHIEEICEFDILDNYIDFPVDLIKIDVEGHEYNVLKGGLNLINKHHPLLLIEDNPPITLEEKETQTKIYNLLQSLGYTLYQFNVYNILAVYE